MHLASRTLLHFLDYLFIHTKVGLNVGRTHGPTSISHYIVPKPKKGPKRGLASVISASHCALSLSGCRSPKNGRVWPSVPQNLVKGQQAPNTHLWLILSHFGLINSISNSLSLDGATLTCYSAATSCSVNSWITASFTSPSMCCSVVMITCSSSTA